MQNGTLKMTFQELQKIPLLIIEINLQKLIQFSDSLAA